MFIKVYTVPQDKLQACVITIAHQGGAIAKCSDVGISRIEDTAMKGYSYPNLPAEERDC